MIGLTNLVRNSAEEVYIMDYNDRERFCDCDVGSIEGRSRSGVH